MKTLAVLYGPDDWENKKPFQEKSQYDSKLRRDSFIRLSKLTKKYDIRLVRA